MIEICNIRKEQDDAWTKLVADVLVTEIDNPFEEATMWFAVKKENEDMLTDENYNAFFLVPLYLAMYYKTDLKISGKLSERLYRNMKEYGQRIFCNFSDDLEEININIDEMTTEVNNDRNLVGTGLSCGVDSLFTVYRHFQKEKSENYKINSLFIFNCGTHGHYENSRTYETFIKRYDMNKLAADELGLPLYQVNSNLHAFTHKIGEQKMGYIAIHSCILALQKVLRLYYIASSCTYMDTLEGTHHYHDFDFGEFSDPFFIPLVRTEGLELILEGAQYSRSKKTEVISEWPIAQSYLNVCVCPGEDGRNCCRCSKCMRTLIPLEAMGKLDKFTKVFDLDVYRNNAMAGKVELMLTYGKEPFSKDNVDYAQKKGLRMPTKGEIFIFRVKRKIRHLFNRM